MTKNETIYLACCGIATITLASVRHVIRRKEIKKQEQINKNYEAALAYLDKHPLGLNLDDFEFGKGMTIRPKDSTILELVE